MAKPHVPHSRIWNMCCGLFGVQIVWGLQNANTSRIFQTLGADVNELAILWIAAPITGLLLQPIVGRMSDRTWGRLGRRRPYLFYGSICAAIALFLMPNAPSLWAAALMLWILCASVNVAMEPFRALVADTLPEGQRTTGFAIQVFFIGTGAVFASALPWMLSHWFGIEATAAAGVLPASVRVAFYIGGVFLLAAICWTVFTTREVPPEDFGGGVSEDEPQARPAVHHRAIMRSGMIWLAAGTAVGIAAFAGALRREIYLLAAIGASFGAAKLVVGYLRLRGRESLGWLEIVEDIQHMPLVLRRLAVVQFFTWFGLFAMWIYTTPAVTARHYRTTDVTSSAYNAGADWVGVLFAGYNGVAALAAFLLPSLVSRLGSRHSLALCLSLGAAGFLGFLLIDEPGLLWISAIGIGCAWAAILSIPYALISTAVPLRKMGVYMGIHNLFLVLPQLVAATVLGPVVQYVFGGEAILALALSAGAFALAALSALALPDLHRSASYAKIA